MGIWRGRGRTTIISTKADQLAIDGAKPAVDYNFPSWPYYSQNEINAVPIFIELDAIFWENVFKNDRGNSILL